MRAHQLHYPGSLNRGNQGFPSIVLRSPLRFRFGDSLRSHPFLVGRIIHLYLDFGLLRSALHRGETKVSGREFTPWRSDIMQSIIVLTVTLFLLLILVDPVGFEPTTSDMPYRRSGQLSYGPISPQ